MKTILDNDEYTIRSSSEEELIKRFGHKPQPAVELSDTHLPYMWFQARVLGDPDWELVKMFISHDLETDKLKVVFLWQRPRRADQLFPEKQSREFTVPDNEPKTRTVEKAIELLKDVARHGALGPYHITGDFRGLRTLGDCLRKMGLPEEECQGPFSEPIKEG